MKIGILSDIHEHVEELRRAIAVLKEYPVDRFVVLGDVFELGEQLEETVSLLREVEPIGVWGNHDFGLCVQPSEQSKQKYSPAVIEFMGSLRPQLEVEGCLFTHVEPWLDPNSLEDLWYFEGPPDTQEKLDRSFAAQPHRVMFMGHLHRWLIGSTEGILPWNGDSSITLDPAQHYLIVIHAVCRGYCALFDTSTLTLTPFTVGQTSAEDGFSSDPHTEQ